MSPACGALPLPDDKILDWSKLKQIVDNILTHSHKMTPFDASGKEAFWKHCGKRRNCLYKQFLLYPQCFLLYQRQKPSFLLHSICHLQMLSVWSGPNFIVWEWVKAHLKWKKVYGRKHCEKKGEIARYKQLLLFSQCFPQLYIFSASKMPFCVVMG